MEPGEDRVPGSGTSLFITILGAWLILSPFLLSRLDGVSLTPVVLWNDIVVGLLIVVTGIWATQSLSLAPNWAHMALGGWLVAAPMLLGYHFNAGWNDMAVGAIVFLSGLVVMAQKSAAVRPRMPGT